MIRSLVMIFSAFFALTVFAGNEPATGSQIYQKEIQAFHRVSLEDAGIFDLAEAQVVLKRVDLTGAHSVNRGKILEHVFAVKLSYKVKELDGTLWWKNMVEGEILITPISDISSIEGEVVAILIGNRTQGITCKWETHYSGYSGSAEGSKVEHSCRGKFAEPMAVAMSNGEAPQFELRLIHNGTDLTNEEGFHRIKLGSLAP